MQELERRECVHEPEMEDYQVRGFAASIKALPPDPLSANCHRDFTAVHHSGTRPLSAIDLVVLHSTEGNTAEGAARWFANPASAGSTHLVVDDNTCYRVLRDDQVPWGAPGANFHGFHIEQAGFASWSLWRWQTLHNKTLRRAAFKAALHCKRYGIQVRFLEAPALRLGVRDGITTHAECTKAFGGNHTDPGQNWPRALFMGYVRAYLAVIKVRRVA